MTREEFIEAHIKVCSKTGSTRHLRRPGTPHKGRGAFRVKNEAHRRRECARSLYKWCQKVNTPLVHKWEDLPKDKQPNRPLLNSEKDAIL